MDGDLLSPELGRLIDAAKAAAAASAAAAPGLLAEGWALLTADGSIYAGPDLAAILVAAQAGGKPTASEPVAVAFAVAGEAGETFLPGEECRLVLKELDPALPLVAKHLGRWVAVPLAELPPV